MEKKKEEQYVAKTLIDIDKYLTPPGDCKCGKGLFVYQGLGLYKCEHCGELFRNEYAIVRDFVEKYGTNYSILEIAELTGVRKPVIDLFVKDGRFDTVEKQRVCIICKQPIDSGLYCKRCSLMSDDVHTQKSVRKITSGVRNEEMVAEMHHGRQNGNINEDRRNSARQDKKEKK